MEQKPETVNHPAYARNRYIEHRENAVRRGIQFLLTFEQWWKIWQDSGHWEERGCKSYQYVMARFGDKGPYETDNVNIITWKQNIQEREVSDVERQRVSEHAKQLVFTQEMRQKISRSKQGTNNYHVKLKEESVLIIRASSKTNEQLALEFGVSRSTINMIVNRKTWRHI